MMLIRLALVAGLAAFGAASLASAEEYDATPSVAAITPPKTIVPTDADLPDFSIRVMRDGTEIEVSGGFKLGIAREFRRILEESPDLRVVHLDSMGGWVNEGEAIRRMIADRGLSTYVADICVSACTVAFAGGVERWIHPLGRIGFHTFASSRLNSTEIAAYIAREKVNLAAAGYDPAFLDRALSVPYEEVWYPTPDELIGARVVTALAEPDQFALSGLGPDVSRDGVARGFAAVLPMLEAIRVLEPARFDQMIDALHSAYVTGATESELFEITRGSILPLIQAYLPLSDDSTVLSFAGLVLDQYRTLLGADGRLCFEYALGINDPREILAHLPGTLQERELHLEEEILRTAKAGREMTAPDVLKSYWGEVAARLGMEMPSENLSVLAAQAAADAGLQTQYCQSSIALFEGMLELGEAKASALFRDFFGAAGRL
jgi:hypothetical protein